MRYFELGIFGNGGEYTAGIIKEKTAKEKLISLARSGELDFYNDATDSGIELSCFENDDILHSYGININDNPEITIKELKSSKAEDYLTEEVIWDNFSKELPYEEEINYASFNNPYIDTENEDQESLILLGLSADKKMYASYLLEIKEELNTKNIFISTILMDEIFLYNDEVLNSVFYFEQKQFILWIEKKIKEDTIEAKTISNMYSDYKEELNNKDTYHEYLAEFLGEIVSEFAIRTGVNQSKENHYNLFDDFKCEVLSDPEGRNNFIEVKLENIDGKEIE